MKHAQLGMVKTNLTFYTRLVQHEIFFRSLMYLKLCRRINLKKRINPIINKLLTTGCSFQSFEK